jgi:hypothetical protein
VNTTPTKVVYAPNGVEHAWRIMICAQKVPIMTRGHRYYLKTCPTGTDNQHYFRAQNLPNMCDAVSTSIIFGALSLLPGNRYILWAFASAWLTIYVANQQRPSHKLGRVERKIFEARKSQLSEEPWEMDGTRRLLE